VRVGVFPVISSLPVFVGEDQGYFKDAGIAVETVRLIGGPPNVAALIGNQIDAAANLVTIEGLNADLKKPGVALYISLNVQNTDHPMEQIVLRKGLTIASLADLKGKKVMSSPGPANVTMAKAALAKAGLKDGDYQIDQLDQAQHVGAMTSGNYDAAYTLEPDATLMRKNEVATTYQTGVIARTVFDDPKANVWASGCAVSKTFLDTRPDVAKRFAAAWGKAVAFIAAHPDEARKSLLKNTFTAPAVVDTVPLPGARMVSDLSPKEIDDFQAFMDFVTAAKVLPEKVDVRQALAKF
jgi:NitT/TauT family transport system substrate-binding protein